jgi:hypothetical protein
VVFTLSRPVATRSAVAAAAIAGVALTLLGLFVLVRFVPVEAHAPVLVAGIVLLLALAVAADRVLSTRVVVDDQQISIQTHGRFLGTRVIARESVTRARLTDDEKQIFELALSDGQAVQLGPWIDAWPWSSRVRRETIARLETALLASRGE